MNYSELCLKCRCGSSFLNHISSGICGKVQGPAPVGPWPIYQLIQKIKIKSNLKCPNRHVFFIFLFLKKFVLSSLSLKVTFYRNVCQCTTSLNKYLAHRLTISQTGLQQVILKQYMWHIQCVDFTQNSTVSRYTCCLSQFGMFCTLSSEAKAVFHTSMTQQVLLALSKRKLVLNMINLKPSMTNSPTV